MAAIIHPHRLSTAMGLVAAVLIGQIAIDVGLFVPEVILYVAVAAIGNFVTPSYELSIANKSFTTRFAHLCRYFSHTWTSRGYHNIYHSISTNSFT